MSLHNSFHLITAVWGDEYLSTFLEVTLPNHLSKGNLDAFDASKDAIYKIYTSEKDLNRIEENIHYKKIARMMKTSIMAVPGLYTPVEYKLQADHAKALSAMNRLHRLAIAEANAENATLIFLAPDMLFSVGSFSKLLEFADLGKRAVVIPSIRAVKEKFLPEFERLFKDEYGHFQAPARDMVRLALKHVHQLTEKYFIDSTSFADTPRNIFWRVGDEGLLGRCSHFHPLMICPEEKTIFPLLAIDHDYYITAISDYKDFYIVSDSDDIVAVDLSYRDKQAELIIPRKFKELTFATRLADNVDNIELKFLRSKVRIHAGELTEKWKPIEKESNKIVGRILATARLLRKRSERVTMVHNIPLHAVKRVMILGSGRMVELVKKFAQECEWEWIYNVIDKNSQFSLPAIEHVDLTIVVAGGLKKDNVFKKLNSLGYVYGVNYIHYNDIFCHDTTGTGYIYKRIRLDNEIVPLIKDGNRHKVMIGNKKEKYFKRGELFDISHRAFCVRAQLYPHDPIILNGVYDVEIEINNSDTGRAAIKAQARFKRMLFDVDDQFRYRRYVFDILSLSEADDKLLNEFVKALEESED